MRKQRGQANGVVVVLVAIAIILIIAAISLSHSDKKKHHGKHMTVSGEFLKPTADGRGRYAYQSDNGNDWYIYYWIMTDNNRYYAPYDGGGYTYTTISLPAGGTWVKSDEPEEDEVIASNITEQVAETNAGVPETEEEFQTENQTDIENQSVEPENTTEPSAEPSTPDSSPSDSGGDSGGDGGGDGGSSD